jgi:hypothetical protein
VDGDVFSKDLMNQEVTRLRRIMGKCKHQTALISVAQSISGGILIVGAVSERRRAAFDVLAVFVLRSARAPQGRQLDRAAHPHSVGTCVQFVGFVEIITAYRCGSLRSLALSVCGDRVRTGVMSPAESAHPTPKSDGAADEQ